MAGSKKGFIDFDDGCWIQFGLVTSLRCWSPILVNITLQATPLIPKEVIVRNKKDVSDNRIRCQMNAVDISENSHDVDNTNISYGPYGHTYLEDLKVKNRLRLSRCALKRADSETSSIFRHGLVMVPPWDSFSR